MNASPYRVNTTGPLERIKVYPIHPFRTSTGLDSDHVTGLYRGPHYPLLGPFFGGALSNSIEHPPTILPEGVSRGTNTDSRPERRSKERWREISCRRPKTHTDDLMNGHTISTEEVLSHCVVSTVDEGPSGRITTGHPVDESPNPLPRDCGTTITKPTDRFIVSQT